ncbi:MAG: Periplasmic component of the Tol biopolymer transport system-like protein [Bryobacterales bacterium]|nr:Periplasmic component of the Tol biopolymer transport system-like protein [Bryobacterales bacterium]
MSRLLVAALSGMLALTAQTPVIDRGIFTDEAAVGNAAGGSVAVSPNREYHVSGGGADVWGTSDDFHFVWKKLTGDVTFTADVRFEGPGAFPRRKAMLMLRQSLDGGSPYVDAAWHGNGLTSLQFRGKAGEQTYQIATQMEGPVRLRIVRAGNRFTVFAGKPGGSLAQLGPIDPITLGASIYLGLGVCSHVAGTLETAVFSNVTIEQTAKP